ncbi:HNH endonuclease [Agromyces protaetiae]|uniref:HNH endonuclease n=1 Tax=Agromyces protaetiae TaxID=2509455 RepID=A0A4P6F909_9MICO|nr:HNH endonuclease signature motif containing protein [Agromyces protaetiae]QAY72026.1 HNH endonuclease [Agromyces protaetiae]
MTAVIADASVGLPARAVSPSELLELDLSTDLDAIVELERSIRIAQAEQLRLVRRARETAALLEGVHDGSTSTDREFATRSFIAELATALVVPEVRASGMLGDAVCLERLPETSAAFARGDLGLAHVQAVIEATSGASAALSARLEAEAIERAPRQTPPALRRALRRFRERFEPVPLEERRAAAERDRRVCVEPARDGMAWLSVFMRAERAYAIKDRLDALAADAADASSSPVDTRTRAQRCADIAANLLLAGALAEGEFAAVTQPGLVKPRVLVTVPVFTLMGLSEEPADLDGYGPIDADTARRLAADAPSFTRILTHPETGAFLSYGRTTYRVPADLAGYLAVRDGGCRFPGCGRRARESDIDHTVDWARGGETRHDNLAHLCRSHHRLKHHTRWRMEQETGGVVRWRGPSGREVLSPPPLSSSPIR